eukprot:TRINITY_DN1666_c0_g1_i1.p1 TRINITY_DN1666_c0_g1~~TRINITY_DN1666_c0_g1_i1.p1  ORF type:complete len:535 (+),score=227.67 TRINITY_DN1666_c0_g1_i1:85-1689(+)
MSRYGATQHTAFSDVEPCSVRIDQVPEAVQSLRAAFDSDKTRSLSWRKQQLRQLIKLLREGRSELSAAMRKDLGKSEYESYVTEIGMVESEARGALAHLDQWAKPTPCSPSAVNWPARCETVRDPLGVVLVMGAWNYPCQLTLAPVVGAIAGGNCVLIRPGSYAVETSHALCRLCDRYLDRECIRVAEGDRHLTTKILEQKFDTIFYTGSGFVGKLVAEAAAKHLCPTILELGGKSPTIVDASANVQHAAERIVWATFCNSGQTCVRPDFCLVHEKVADQFCAAVKRTIREFYTENPQKTEWFGRIINAKAHERLSKLVEQGKANIMVGGHTDAAERYVEPTVFDFGSDLEKFRAHPLMQDEIFGPLLPMARWSNLEDVVQFVRNLPTGKPLALYVYTRDAKVEKEIIRRTTCGGMCVNDSVMHLTNHELPFGGVGESGMGSYHGVRSFNAFTHEKAVMAKSASVDMLPGLRQIMTVRFPPYVNWKQRAVDIVGSRVMDTVPALGLRELRRFFVRLAVFWLVLRLLGFKITLSS